MSGEEGATLLCPRCSAAVEPGQDYCLDCGLRLPRTPPGPLERASAGMATRQPWAGTWFLPALLGLVIAVLGAGAAIAISSNGEKSAAVSTATGGSLTVAPSTATLTAPEPTATAPTTTSQTAPATTAPPVTTAPKPPPANPATIRWPAGKRGWTIVLLSLPQNGAGRTNANARAAQARKAGLRQVGILDSSRFASLHPGYYVVFQGVYESEAEAASSVQRARGVFPAAYQRAIVP